MRGAERALVDVVLVTSGALTGGLVGFAAGVAWAVSPLPALSTAGSAAVALVAVAADVVWRTAGHPKPLAVGRQVPVVWGRVFGARVAGVLYGARLGVGPLTILASWTWWAALVVGASAGPGWSALVGAAFALARTATMAAVVHGVETGTAMSARVGRLRRVEGTVAWGVAVALGLAGLALLAGCSDDGDERAAKPPPAEDDQEEPVREIELEPSTTSTTIVEDVALGEVLLTDVLEGFAMTEDRVLDLRAAAELEQDVEAEQALLSTRRFVRAHSRAWVDASEDVVYEAVYLFGDDADAAAYLADGVETLASREAIAFPVPEVPGAVGFTTLEESAEGAFTAHVVAFSRGPRWFLLLVGTAGTGRSPDEVRDLARRQSERQAFLTGG